MHGSQFIVLIIFAAIGVINTLIRKSAAAPKRRVGPGTPPATPRSNLPQYQRPAQTGDTQDERLRQFMEALGVPAQVAAPPPRQIARPSQPVARRSLPPVRKPAVAVPRVPIRAPEPAQPAYQAETVGGQPEKTGYEVAAPVAPVTGVSYTAGTTVLPATVSLRTLLGSPSSIRTAMVLKEILGPPRGLQPMDALHGLR